MEPNLRNVPVQQMPTTTPDNHVNLLPVIVVGIVMLILGLGGGYLLFANKGQVKQVVTQTSPTTVQQVNPTSIPSPTISSSTTSWKTYEAKGYSIQAPSTWVAETGQDNNGAYFRIFNPSTMADVPNVNVGNGTLGGQTPKEELRITADISSNKTAKQYVDSIAPTTIPSLYQDFLKGRKTITVNNLSAEVYPDTGEGSTGDNIVVNNNNGVLFKIHVIGDYNSGVLKQILSTFKPS